MADALRKGRTNVSVRYHANDGIGKGRRCTRRSCLCDAPWPCQVPESVLQQLKNQSKYSSEITCGECSNDEVGNAMVGPHAERQDAEGKANVSGGSSKFQEISARVASKRVARSSLPTLLATIGQGAVHMDTSDKPADLPGSLKALEQLRIAAHAEHDRSLSGSPCSSTSMRCVNDSIDVDTSQAPAQHIPLPSLVADLAHCLRGAYRNSIMISHQPTMDSTVQSMNEKMQEIYEREDAADVLHKGGSSRSSRRNSVVSAYRDFFTTSHKFKTPLTERLNRVQLRRSAKMREIRNDRTYELKQRRYDALPRSEIQDIERAFHHFDKNGTKFLSRDKIVLCLRELGIKSKNVEEKRELECAFQCNVEGCSRPPCNWRVAQPCCTTCQETHGRAHSSYCDQKFEDALSSMRCEQKFEETFVQQDTLPKIDSSRGHSIEGLATPGYESAAFPCSSPSQDYRIHLFDFALTVMPDVRQRLMNLRSDAMLNKFFQLDADNSGLLSRTECGEIAKMFGIDRRLVDEVCAKGTFTGIDFDQFQVLVFIGKEKAERIIRSQERCVQEQLCLSDETFHKFRHDLVVLYQLFQMYDVDRSGTLGDIEFKTMIKEFGLTPKTRGEKEEIESILQRALLQRALEHAKTQNRRKAPHWAKAQEKLMQRRRRLRADGFNFEEFLGLIEDIRRHKREKSHAEHLEKFERYDKDGNGMLCVSEIWYLLSDLGFIPMNFKEQTELAYLIHVSDEDMSGHINFSEFQVLCQKIEEKLLSLRHEEEMDHALRLGFSDERIRDLRLIFDSLDTDGSNKLSEVEVRDALVYATDEVSRDAFKAGFVALDHDKDGELDFKEFLTFMKMMRDGEGLFASLPRKLTNLPERVLRRILEYFHLGKTYVSTLSREDLIHLFCDFMHVHESCDLQKALSITTVDELLEIAKKRAGRSSIFCT